MVQAKHLTGKINTSEDGFQLVKDEGDDFAEKEKATGAWQTAVSAGASSTHLCCNHAPAELVDGDHATCWANKRDIDGDGPNAWVSFDLGSPVNVEKVKLFPYSNPAYNVKNFEVQAEVGTNWVSVGTFEGGTSGEQVFDIEPTNAQKWRLNLKSTHGGVHFVLCEVSFFVPSWGQPFLADASSTHPCCGHTAAELIDPSLTQCWANDMDVDGAGPNVWVSFDWGSTVTAMGFKYSAYQEAAYNVKDFEVEAQVGTNWVSVGTFAGGTSGEQVFDIDPTSAQKWRFKLKSAHGGDHFALCAVYFLL
jgi:hypothetical protein